MDAPAEGNNTEYPLLVVLSGPSGVGKDAVLRRMRELGAPFRFIVTVTTRAQRQGEQNGVDYIFASVDDFRRMIAAGELLEWAEVYGNYYGVPKSQVTRALEQGWDVIIKADVQGATTIRGMAADAVFLFLAPPSLEELAHRLTQRLTESSEALALRLQIAENEMAESVKFDHVVVNHTGRVDEAVSEISEIVRCERARVPPRVITL